jgi:hypothetical protein
MNERSDDIVPPGASRFRVLKLIEWAERHGLTVELARAAYRTRPRKEGLRQIYGKLGLSPDVTVQSAGTKIAADRCPIGSSSEGLG